MLGKIVGAVVGILSLAIAQRQGTTTVARPRREKRCRFEGVFILDGTGGVHVLDLAIPLDSANNRVALQHDLADYDVTLGGQLPTAVRYSTAQGEAVRTGPRRRTGRSCSNRAPYLRLQLALLGPRQFESTGVIGGK